MKCSQISETEALDSKAASSQSTNEEDLHIMRKMLIIKTCGSIFCDESVFNYFNCYKNEEKNKMGEHFERSRELSRSYY